MIYTHGTNSYDFNLVTVLVVDEFGEGYPIAWCFLLLLIIIRRNGADSTLVEQPQW